MVNPFEKHDERGDAGGLFLIFSLIGVGLIVLSLFILPDFIDRALSEETKTSLIGSDTKKVAEKVEKSLEEEKRKELW